MRKEWRGKGYGLQLWERAIDRLGSLPIGLDGVIAQQENYKRAGFTYAYGNVRFQSDAREARYRVPSMIALEPIRELEADVVAYDLACFGTPREGFLKGWFGQIETVALAARSLETGELLGYAVGRPCREGTKIAPLFASRLDVALVLFDAVAQRTGSPWFLDVPAVNGTALALADDRGMKRVFETARMWRGNRRRRPMPGACVRGYVVRTRVILSVLPIPAAGAFRPYPWRCAGAPRSRAPAWES